MGKKNQDMQQHCNHNVFCDAPIIDVFEFSGRPVNFHCRGNLNDVILGMKLLTRRLPQSLPAKPTAPAETPVKGRQTGRKLTE
jgi:hypothetical protein